MAVVQVSTVTVQPGRFAEYVEDARKWKAVIQRLGGKNVRLLAASVAGQATGTLALIEEADDYAAWGALVDKIGADPEGMELMSGAAADLVSGYQSAIWVDVPL